LIRLNLCVNVTRIKIATCGFDDLIQTIWLVITNLYSKDVVAVLDGIKPVKSTDCS